MYYTDDLATIQERLLKDISNLFLLPENNILNLLNEP